jgi:hypothetical protein
VDEIRVKVEKVLFDPKVDASVVLLKEMEGDRVLPIWIGPPEALAIIMELEKISLGRPMTHDLLKNTIDALGASVQWIRVSDLVEGTFIASIQIVHSKKEIEIDSRPSDAIALAIRANAPIFVAVKVFEEALNLDPGANVDTENLKEDFLSTLPDDAFGKYKM